MGRSLKGAALAAAAVLGMGANAPSVTRDDVRAGIVQSSRGERPHPVGASLPARSMPARGVYENILTPDGNVRVMPWSNLGSGRKHWKRKTNRARNGSRGFRR